MTRLLLGAVTMCAGLAGCASPARNIEFNPQSGTGVVAIPSDSDSWPYYHMSAAKELIRKNVGPNYVIDEQKTVVVGKSTTNNQQVNNQQLNNQQSLVNQESVTTTQDVTEYRIWYRRTAGGPMTGGPLPGSGNGLTQTQYQGVNGNRGITPAGGIVPSMDPRGGVVPASGGAMYGGGTTGGTGLGGTTYPR